ncbi:hypothetical protein D9619_008117 [Psilocybe cf. subviscida]|uniref:Uncharacterized protein n=1 Tax=Psilocybe cf. subviscida TaxID=2480587 RepID=A0A8H5ATL8_9AGAR|nr:hypothetical protein D9619_008117 [Psilocybe cf. subviscida]
MLKRSSLKNATHTPSTLELPDTKDDKNQASKFDLFATARYFGGTYSGLLLMYRIFCILAVALSSQLLQVSACEGECISGLTNALLGNFSRPLNIALEKMAGTIVTRLIPNSEYARDPISLLSPIISSYNKRAYDTMEQAVFPGYFHGKCQDPTTGIDPPGCPNPDCPVRCGTPGSIVHFYGKFIKIAFATTAELIGEITEPDASSYKLVEKSVKDAISNSKARRSYPPFIFRGSKLLSGNQRRLSTRNDHVKDELNDIFGQAKSILADICGGVSASDHGKDLPNCRWEQRFKQYILSFP